MQVDEKFGNRKEQRASNVAGNDKRKNAVRKQGCREPMTSSKKSDARFRVSSVRIGVLLIGRSLHSERVCYIGGVAKAKYTTPHDIALR